MKPVSRQSSPMTEALPNRESLQQTIEEETFRQICDLTVSIRDGFVNVSGLSRSFYVKQLVTRAVRGVAPQARLANNVAVFLG